MDHFPAHIRRSADGTSGPVQTVREHCRNTAQYAAQALEPVFLSASGYLAGLIHDSGKYTERFKDYILNQSGARGSVNHTFAAVKLLLDRYHTDNCGDFADVVSELLALASGAHDFREAVQRPLEHRTHTPRSRSAC